MGIRRVAKYEYMKSLWFQAFTEELVFDYTGEPHAEGRISLLRVALYNYRRRIRKYKLRPEYSEEWVRITKCEVSRQSDTILVIRKIPELLFGRKEIPSRPNLPFETPTSLLKISGEQNG